MAKKKKSNRGTVAPISEDYRKRLEAFAKNANEEFGIGTIMTADSVGEVDIPRVSSGIWALDKAMGGGWPLGRFSAVYGNESSGKTSLLLRAVGNAQHICGNCFRRAKLVKGTVPKVNPNTGEVEEVESEVVGKCKCGNPKNLVVAWIDQEGVWSDRWARDLGILPERLIVSRPQYAEQGIDIITNLLYGNIADIIVIDSLAAFTPMKEIEGSSADVLVGEAARLLNGAFRKWNSALNARAKQSRESGVFNIPSIWIINQIRLKIGVMFGDPTTRPGGKGQLFAASVEVRTGGGKSKSNYNVDEEIMDTISVELSFLVKKNKTAPAMQGGKYKMCVTRTDSYERGEIMDHEMVFDHALRLGIVEQVSSRKYSFNGQEYSSKSLLLREWIDNKKLYQKVKDETLKLALM